MQTEANKLRKTFDSQHASFEPKLNACQTKALKTLGDTPNGKNQSWECLLPMLLLKWHASILIDNWMFDLEKCISQGVPDRVQETLKVKCLRNYDQGLTEDKKAIDALYTGYLKNYDPTSSMIVDPKTIN